MEPSLSIDLFDVLTDRNPTHWVGIHVCGNYCGVGWCGGHEVQERYAASDPFLCEFDAPPLFCEDACCKEHDRCCSLEADRTSCNDALLACAAACAVDEVAEGGRPACAYAAAGIAIADSQGLCCGSDCSGNWTAAENGANLRATDLAHQLVKEGAPGGATVHVPLGWLPWIGYESAEPTATAEPPALVGQHCLEWRALVVICAIAAVAQVARCLLVRRVRGRASALL